jgi:hypothetical protein
MYTIRFHLGNDSHFGHYQVRLLKGKNSQGDVVEYINPSTHSLLMVNCRLYKSDTISANILSGKQKKKKPCAWVICESYTICDVLPTTDNEITFNPRKSADWLLNGQECNDITPDVISTNSNKLYI